MTTSLDLTVWGDHSPRVALLDARHGLQLLPEQAADPSPAARSVTWVSRGGVVLLCEVAALGAALLLATALTASPAVAHHAGVPAGSLLLAWLVLHVLLVHAIARPAFRLAPSAVALLPGVLRAAGYGVALDLALAHLLDLTAAGWFAVLAATAAVPLLVAVHGTLLALRSRAARTHGPRVPTVVLGHGEGAQSVCAAVLSHPESGLRLVGTVGERPSGSHAWLGDADRLRNVLSEHAIAHVLVPSSLPDGISGEALVDVLAAHAGQRVRVSWVAVHPALVQPDGRHDRLGRLGVVHLREPRPRPVTSSLRAVLDRVLALLLLVAVSPVLLAAALWVVVDSRGPAFFRQERVGRDGRPFRIVKLRSMAVDAELKLADLMAQNQAHGPLFKIREDPRVTRAGRLLRRTSIDELPQLWNVVKGDMSLIGPRPALPEEVALYPDWFHRRLAVKPGITGLWQVSGRAELSFQDAVALDLCYVDAWTPWLDVQILLRTVGTVLQAKGSY